VSKGISRNTVYPGKENFVQVRGLTLSWKQKGVRMEGGTGLTWNNLFRPAEARFINEGKRRLGRAVELQNALSVSSGKRHKQKCDDRRRSNSSEKARCDQAWKRDLQKKRKSLLLPSQPVLTGNIETGHRQRRPGPAEGNTGEEKGIVCGFVCWWGVWGLFLGLRCTKGQSARPGDAN